MSQATVSVTGYTDAFVSSTLPLLKEYSDKMGRLIELWFEQIAGPLGASTTKDRKYRSERRILLEMQTNYLLPPAEKLARTVSGMIANGRLDEFERLESEIRLAEFEVALLTLSRLRQTAPPPS